MLSFLPAPFHIYVDCYPPRNEEGQMNLYFPLILANALSFLPEYSSCIPNPENQIILKICLLDRLCILKDEYSRAKNSACIWMYVCNQELHSFLLLLLLLLLGGSLFLFFC